jgi:hypothetical protein
MNLTDFKSSLSSTSVPPNALPKSLQAMWFDGNGDWNSAHEIAQDIRTPDGSWIHAYLHRKEGDTGNATYWYHRANKPVCNTSPEEEWDSIVAALLS